jgi:hypothetical protein
MANELMSREKLLEEMVKYLDEYFDNTELANVANDFMAYHVRSVGKDTFAKVKELKDV